MPSHDVTAFHRWGSFSPCDTQ